MRVNPPTIDGDNGRQVVEEGTGEADIIDVVPHGVGTAVAAVPGQPSLQSPGAVGISNDKALPVGLLA